MTQPTNGGPIVRRTLSAEEETDIRRRIDEERQRSQQRAQLKLDRWGPEEGTGRMTRLCRRFPSFREADGVEPWCIDRLLVWAFSGAPTGGTWHCIRFVLQVWNSGTDWPGYLLQVATRKAPAVSTRCITGTPDKLESALAEARRKGQTARLMPAELGRAAEVEIDTVDEDDAHLWRRLQLYQQHVRRDLEEEARDRGGRLSEARLQEKLQEALNKSFARFGGFNVVEALSTWDAQHSAAFLAWCEAPFWP